MDETTISDIKYAWNIQTGFKHTGLWPPNRGTIKPDQLGPSAVSDKCKLFIVKLKFMFGSFVLTFGSVFKKINQIPKN